MDQIQALIVASQESEFLSLSPTPSFSVSTISSLVLAMPTSSNHYFVTKHVMLVRGRLLSPKLSIRTLRATPSLYMLHLGTKNLTPDHFPHHLLDVKRRQHLPRVEFPDLLYLRLQQLNPRRPRPRPYLILPTSHQSPMRLLQIF